MTRKQREHYLSSKLLGSQRNKVDVRLVLQGHITEKYAAVLRDVRTYVKVRPPSIHALAASSVGR